MLRPWPTFFGLGLEADGLGLGLATQGFGLSLEL